jgi:hypothetical protein
MLRTQAPQTTIAISKRNHEFLTEIGRKGQSFDDVITEIRNGLEKKSGNKVYNKNLLKTDGRVGTSQEQSSTGYNDTNLAQESSAEIG